VIFPKDLEERIQRAIDDKDLDFLSSLIKNRKKVKRDKKATSFLMVPANKAKFLNKIDELDVDCLIINLEDGVAKEYKKVALYAAMVFITNVKNSPLIVVRVNPIDSGGLYEIEMLNQINVDGIRVAKIKDKEDVIRVKEILNPNIDLHISVETKEAFNMLYTFKDLDIKACYLGILDLLNDLDIPQSILQLSNPTIEYILSKFLIDSSSIKALPISFVYQDYKNLEEFERWCRLEKSMGFRAKVAISPKQAEIVNKIFKIDEEEVKRAIYIKKQFEKNLKKGISGFSDELYGFIDEPIYKDALNILKNLD
jgi:citrate lyase subunit beta/citryl-CoA lyase